MKKKRDVEHQRSLSIKLDQYDFDNMSTLGGVSIFFLICLHCSNVLNVWLSRNDLRLFKENKHDRICIILAYFEIFFFKYYSLILCLKRMKRLYV